MWLPSDIGAEFDWEMIRVLGQFEELAWMFFLKGKKHINNFQLT